ncbi:MAG: hypothetical protein ACJ74O_00210 [Frankiaceae bacterium]
MAAAGAALVVAGCGGHAQVGVDEQGRPAKGLVTAAAAYATALARGDRAGLAAMNAPGYRQDRLAATLNRYGGHPVRAKRYAGENAVGASVRYAVDCGSNRQVSFWQPFFYVKGTWRPALGGPVGTQRTKLPTASPPAVSSGASPSGC